MFVLWSLERILLFLRFILTSLSNKGGFAERLAPATWKRVYTINLKKTLIKLHKNCEEMFLSAAKYAQFCLLTVLCVKIVFFNLKLSSLIKMLP